ncbi:DUF488 domain-containing protein [Afifella pfennigii]|uniref:DUF488 domain-containing protein n=1 Tax=Afifella pfennigii TaxID=209897 RepID=UPI00047C54E7|nr:DUF488 family protein [Afifella pfennigii]
MSGGAGIGLARAYDPPQKGEGARLLVDRIWPRGLSKEKLSCDDWIKEAAPSAELRRWFAHDAKKWAAFRARYEAELEERPEAVERCLAWCREGRVTLLFGAKDREHNQAVALRDYLARKLKGEAEARR